MTDAKNTAFPRLKPQEKADRTTQVARELADQDRVAREKKTLKLRALRLAREAEAPAVAPRAKPAAKKAKPAR